MIFDSCHLIRASVKQPPGQVSHALRACPIAVGPAAFDAVAHMPGRTFDRTTDGRNGIHIGDLTTTGDDAASTTRTLQCLSGPRVDR